MLCRLSVQLQCLIVAAVAYMCMCVCVLLTLAGDEGNYTRVFLLFCQHDVAVM